MILSLADLHCDTPYELFHKKESFFDTEGPVSARYASGYAAYTQLFAIWSDRRLSDEEAYRRYREILDRFRQDLAENHSPSSHRYFLGVEDARILCEDLSRLNTLKEDGVRVLTLLWAGKTCIGGGFDTSEPLTEFGKAVVTRCFELGIVPDISHASPASANDVFSLNPNRLPIIASHSDFYEIHPHPRNLTREQIDQIRSVSGRIGINLCCDHLGISDNRDVIPTLLRHIEYGLEHAGEDVLCLGCDYDGTNPPSELSNISLLPRLAQEMQKHYSESVIHKFFYTNAHSLLN